MHTLLWLWNSKKRIGDLNALAFVICLSCFVSARAGFSGFWSPTQEVTANYNRNRRQ
jgi:hypothetical protein